MGLLALALRLAREGVARPLPGVLPTPRPEVLVVGTVVSCAALEAMSFSMPQRRDRLGATGSAWAGGVDRFVRPCSVGGCSGGSVRGPCRRGPGRRREG